MGQGVDDRRCRCWWPRSSRSIRGACSWSSPSRTRTTTTRNTARWSPAAAPRCATSSSRCARPAPRARDAASRPPPRTGAWRWPTASRRDGAVSLRDGPRSASYGELAAAAAKLPVPTESALKDARGLAAASASTPPRLDAAPRSTAARPSASTSACPACSTRCWSRCPHFGGTLKSFDGRAAQAVAGRARRCVEMPTAAVAVVADGYWAAHAAPRRCSRSSGTRGRARRWIPRRSPRGQRRMLAEQSGAGARGRRARRRAGRRAGRFDAEYRVPYLAHAAMEPMNAVAAVTADGAEVWAGNQAPDVPQGLVARRARDRAGEGQGALDAASAAPSGGARTWTSRSRRSRCRERGRRAGQGDLVARGRHAARPLPARGHGRDARRFRCRWQAARLGCPYRGALGDDARWST